MRNIYLEADEKYAVAMFQADSRVRTIEAMEEAIPFVKDDNETYTVLISAIEKLKQMSDLEYRKEDWDRYLLDEESEDGIE